MKPPGHGRALPPRPQQACGSVVHRGHRAGDRTCPGLLPGGQWGWGVGLRGSLQRHQYKLSLWGQLSGALTESGKAGGSKGTWEPGFPPIAAGFRAVLQPGPLSLWKPWETNGNLAKEASSSEKPTCTFRPDRRQGQGAPWQTSWKKRPSPPSLVPSRTGQRCGAAGGAPGPVPRAGLRAQPRHPHPRAPHRGPSLRCRC